MDKIQQAINNNNAEALKKAIYNYSKQNPDPQGEFFFLGLGANGIGSKPTWLSYLFYNIGNECSRADKYSLAITMYEEALKEGFKNPSVYNNMAASYKRMENYKKALECFHYIIDNFPDYTSVYGRIAIFLKAYNVKNSKPPKEYLMEFFRLGGNIDMLQDFVTGNHSNEMVALRVLLDDYYDNSNNSRFSSEKLSSTIHTKIAGVTFEGRQKYVSLLKGGERLLLLREPYNPHDSNAIAVSNLRNNILGHIPKELAAKLAPHIDSGIVYEAFVEEITGGNNYTYGCNIIIYNKSSVSPTQTNVTPQPINVDKSIDVTGWTLLTAVEKGEVEIVKKLVYQGADVNAKGSCNRTPLQWAAYKGNKEITEILISKGAEINTKDSCDRTPLHSAVEGGNKEIAEILISKGADINAKDNFIGNTPLHFASECGHKELVELLISKGANVNAKDKNGPTPLLLAIDNSGREGYNKEIIKILISNGANVNTEDHRGETPLYWGLRH